MKKKEEILEQKSKDFRWRTRKHAAWKNPEKSAVRWKNNLNLPARTVDKTDRITKKKCSSGDPRKITE